MKNKDKGTFGKIANGDAAAAFKWSAAMRHAGFGYSETYEVIKLRTGLEPSEWDELIREGANG